MSKKLKKEFPTKMKFTMLMTPSMANFSGHNVHGGEILRILDQVAYACASQYCKSYVVTLCSDFVLFKRPVKVGSLLTFKAKIDYTGKTSMEISIKVISKDVKTKEKTYTNKCHFTMISVDEQMNPQEVPQFIPSTKKEIKEHKHAQKRRNFRKKMGKRI